MGGSNPPFGGGGSGGGVTLVNTGPGLSGGPITTSGTVSLAGPYFAKVDFTYTVPSPLLITTVYSGYYILSAQLTFINLFNGIGAELAIGTLAQPELLLSYAQNIPNTVNTFVTAPEILFTSTTDIYLSISAGTSASSGAGFVNLTIG